MKKIFSSVPVLISFFISFNAAAQTTFSITGGAGLAYVARTNIDAKYQPFVSPHAAAEISVPVFKNGVFGTGLEYVQKGYSSYSKVIGDLNTTKYYGKRKYQYLTIPLTLSYCVYKTPHSKIWVGGGMN